MPIKMINIYFCYPSKKLGGAELLFFRCANYLSKKEDLYKVHYIDFVEGYVAQKSLNSGNIQHIEYRDNTPLYIEPGAIIIIPLSLMVLLKKYFKNSHQLKFLCWSISPSNLTNYVVIKKTNRYSLNKTILKKVGCYVKLLSDKGVIVYMDHNNYYTTSKVFDFASEVNYTPIFIDDFTIPSDIKNNSNDMLCFMWLGRLDMDKRNTIATFMKEIEALSNRKRVKLLIVGSGEEQHYLENLAYQMNYEISFLGQMTGVPLDNLIKNEVDVGIAMGLSSLEIGKLGKPVIVEGFLDSEKEAGALKDYICLCETKGYDVVSPGYKDSMYYNSFEGLVNKIEKNYKEMSMSCAKYVYENHTVLKSGDCLEKAINNVVYGYDNESYEAISYITHKVNGWHSKLARRILRYF